MTQFINKSFSVYSGTGDAYRDNWDAIFGKKAVAQEAIVGAYGETFAKLAKDERPEPEPEPSVGDDGRCPCPGLGAALAVDGRCRVCGGTVTAEVSVSTDEP